MAEITQDYIAGLKSKYVSEKSAGCILSTQVPDDIQQRLCQLYPGYQRLDNKGILAVLTR